MLTFAYIDCDVPEGMTLQQWIAPELRLAREHEAALKVCERLGTEWIEARAHGDVSGCKRLDAESRVADRAARKLERKLRRALKSAHRP